MQQITKNDVVSVIQSRIGELNSKPSTPNTKHLIEDLMIISSLSYGASGQSMVEVIETRIKAISIDKKMFEKYVPAGPEHMSQLFDERQANLREVLEKINK